MSLQARQETIRVRLYRLCHNAQLKGKHYIQTILDSFSWHFMAIPCARDRPIDSACGLYQFFLHHREIARIVSFDHDADFTGKVYKQFYAQMSITQEVHCPCRPQSPGNIVRCCRSMFPELCATPSTCYVRIGTVNGQIHLNPSFHP